MRSLLMKLSLYAAAVDLTAAAATPSNVDLRVSDTLLNNQSQTAPRLAWAPPLGPERDGAARGVRGAGD